jgi:hypothetical protein
MRDFPPEKYPEKYQVSDFGFRTAWLRTDVSNHPPFSTTHRTARTSKLRPGSQRWGF